MNNFGIFKLDALECHHNELSDKKLTFTSVGASYTRAELINEYK